MAKLLCTQYILDFRLHLDEWLTREILSEELRKIGFKINPHILEKEEEKLTFKGEDDGWDYWLQRVFYIGKNGALIISYSIMTQINRFYYAATDTIRFHVENVTKKQVEAIVDILCFVGATSVEIKNISFEEQNLINIVNEGRQRFDSDLPPLEQRTQKKGKA